MAAQSITLVAARNGGATLNLTNSTLSGNNATGSGGGVFSDGVSGTTPVNITNCTITNNRADNDTDSSGTGGGLFIFGGTDGHPAQFDCRFELYRRQSQHDRQTIFWAQSLPAAPAPTI